MNQKIIYIPSSDTFNPILEFIKDFLRKFQDFGCGNYSQLNIWRNRNSSKEYLSTKKYSINLNLHIFKHEDIKSDRM